MHILDLSRANETIAVTDKRELRERNDKIIVMNRMLALLLLFIIGNVNAQENSFCFPTFLTLKEKDLKGDIKLICGDGVTKKLLYTSQRGNYKENGKIVNVIRIIDTSISVKELKAYYYFDIDSGICNAQALFFKDLSKAYVSFITHKSSAKSIYEISKDKYYVFQDEMGYYVTLYKVLDTWGVALELDYWSTK